MIGRLIYTVLMPKPDSKLKIVDTCVYRVYLMCGTDFETANSHFNSFLWNFK